MPAKNIVTGLDAATRRETLDIRRLATPGDWQDVTFQNGWSNYGSGYQTVQYRKWGDSVQIRGTATGGTLGVAMFTLPEGYRPPAHVELPQCGSVTGTVVMLVVKSTGEVEPNSSAFRVAHSAQCEFSTV